MIDPADTRTLQLPLAHGAPREPTWLREALATCPDEADQVERFAAELRRLPAGAPSLEFMSLYEQMLEARDRLYAAWLLTEIDE